MAMLIRLCIFLSSILLCSIVKSQADIKAMLKQIALIAVHVQELEKAIEIAKDGLATIHDIKNGEFNLHRLFFSSLESVSPAVAGYAKIGVIISDELSILSGFQALVRTLKLVKSFPPSELIYVNAVYAHMTSECTQALNNLVAVTTDGPFEMTDDERIRRIDRIYSDMKDKYAFSSQFTQRTLDLVRERNNDENDIQNLKNLE
jgi:hypothetical protein